MLKQILQNLVAQKKRDGLSNGIIRNLLKGVLQFYVLDFIYNSPYGQNLIFTGGSALRICFDLNRLSEDVDFDLEWNTNLDKEKLATEIVAHFKHKLNFPHIIFSIKGKTEKIYLKFPILYDLGIAKQPESENLYVKIEIAENISKYYQTELIPIAQFNLNFLAKTYTPETLMASKIIAILKRTFKKGRGDKITFKGRDYYDLLWFFQKGINPHLKRLTDVLEYAAEKEIYFELENKIKQMNPSYLKEDLLPLFEDGRFIENYCRNYKRMIKKHLTRGSHQL